MFRSFLVAILNGVFAIGIFSVDAKSINYSNQASIDLFGKERDQYVISVLENDRIDV